MATIYSIYATQ